MPSIGIPKSSFVCSVVSLLVSMQGEGFYTGRKTLWLRLFACNLSCQGFLQADPTDPSTYDLPYMDFDVSTVNRLEDLPVWKRGCDSSYSWSKKYAHLNYEGTGDEIASRIMAENQTPTNPRGTFIDPKTLQEAHMCFTGGEPLLPRNQKAVISVLEGFKKHEGGPLKGTTYNQATNMPNFITFETNGTQMLTPESVEYFTNRGKFNSELFFSVSPKLFTVSGEKRTKAIKPWVVKQYQDISPHGQLKFVIGNEDRQWEELEEVVAMFRKEGVNYDVWLMPVGGQTEDQEKIAGDVANRALKAGYHVSARVHAYLWANIIGV